jgi:hypothetical protein
MQVTLTLDYGVPRSCNLELEIAADPEDPLEIRLTGPDFDALFSFLWKRPGGLMTRAAPFTLKTPTQTFVACLVVESTRDAVVVLAGAIRAQRD